MWKNNGGTMIDYNAKNQQYVDRIKKELWSKGEMAELQQKLMNTKIAEKYGLQKPKNDGSAKFNVRQYLAEIESQSAASSIPADPEKLQQKMFAKSKWRKQDAQMRQENYLFGRDGNYAIGESFEDIQERRNRGKPPKQSMPNRNQRNRLEMLLSPYKAVHTEASVTLP